MTQNKFGTMINLAIQQGVVDLKELAKEFEVAESTINRWITGTTIPSLSIQNLIVVWIAASADIVITDETD